MPASDRLLLSGLKLLGPYRAAPDETVGVLLHLPSVRPPSPTRSVLARLDDAHQRSARALERLARVSPDGQGQTASPASTPPGGAGATLAE